MHQVQFCLAYGDFLVGRFLGNVEFARKSCIEGAQADDQRGPGDDAFHAAGFSRGTDVDDLRGVVKGVFSLDALIVKGKIQGAVGEFLYKEVSACVGLDGLDVAVGILVTDDHVAQTLAVLGINDGARESPLGVFAVHGIGDGTSGKTEERGRENGGK